MIRLLVTREMDYALRILRALHQQGQMSAAAVAERGHMQKAITLKLLKQLHAAGIVDSRRGPNGGYLLARPCSRLNLYDLFSALGETIYINRCQQPDYHCENPGNCGLCREFTRVQAVLDSELRRTPLNALFET